MQLFTSTAAGSIELSQTRTLSSNDGASFSADTSADNFSAVSM